MYPPFPKRIIGPTPWMLGIGWSLTMAVLCTLAHYNLKQARDDLALREAGAILQSDMAYHLWATEARGLYVAPGPEMPADPQLAGSPRRDILTRSGQLLTLVTPDYMAQLVQDHPVQAGRARSHIVHANPSSGHPRADEWELTALHRLSSAQPEISEIVTENNVRRLRLIAAIPTSSAAPRADDEPVQHALSITLPLPPVWSGPRADDARLAIAGLGAFWLLGIAGLIYTTQRYQKHRHAREARIEALRLSEERFKQLYEHAPIAYQILDAQLHLTAVNDAWLQLFGYKKSDVLGHPLTHFVSPAFQSQATTAIQHLATTELVQSVELVFQHKDGHPLTLAIQGRAAPDARTGQTTLHCVLHNITEQRSTEVALRESERRYRLLSENIGDLITLYDFRAGRFTYVSPSVNHLLGRTVEETLHGSMQDFLSPKSYAFFTEHIGPRLATFERDAASRQPLTREIELMHKDGRVIFCEVTINILPDSEGRYTLMVSVCHDISERKRIAERLQESEERFRHIIEHAQAGYF
ncbi:MAG: PAS domain-containing protein, partial [Opitutaceae bacterium]|nr:PAS domain-containing protein [Opitutaceae bacterium]